VTTKTTVEFGENISRVLKKLAKEEECTRIQIIRRSISLYAFLKKETDTGCKLVVTDGTEEKKILKEVVLI